MEHTPRRAARWELVQRIAQRLAVDDDLAEAFERTPGKVVLHLGVPPGDLPTVLADITLALAGDIVDRDTVDRDTVDRDTVVDVPADPDRDADRGNVIPARAPSALRDERGQRDA